MQPASLRYVVERVISYGNRVFCSCGCSGGCIQSAKYVNNKRPCDSVGEQCCERVKWMRIGLCDVHEAVGIFAPVNMISLRHVHYIDIVLTGPWTSSVSLFACNFAAIRYPSLLAAVSMDIVVFLICDTV